MLWRREMIRGIYQPRLLPVHTPQGAVTALVFAANTAHDDHVGELPLDEAAAIIARAEGVLGSNRQYLEQLVWQLRASGPGRRAICSQLLQRVQQLGPALSAARAMNAELLLLAGGAALAGLVQGISGFAFAMVAMSVWVWGIEPRLAAVMAVSRRAGRAADRRVHRQARPAPGGAAALSGRRRCSGVPLGTWALPHLDPAAFKLTLGLFLVVCCPAMLLAHRVPRAAVPAAAGPTLLVGLLGGVMGGIGGFSGVLPSLWITLRGWDKDLQRSVIQNFSLVALSATLASYVVAGTGHAGHVCRSSPWSCRRCCCRR